MYNSSNTNSLLVVYQGCKMSGQYKNAPLVYVSATIHTTKLPQLVNDQPGLLEQLMIQLDLPEK